MHQSIIVSVYFTLYSSRFWYKFHNIEYVSRF